MVYDLDGKMSSSDSSEPSPSPSPSPEASFHGPPSLERLVIHFVSAKKALTSTQHGVRATELVTSSRALIEDTAILSAKNTYAGRAVEEQIETLHGIRDGIAVSNAEAGNEFKATIAKLDVANDRLQSTLASLRKVVIDSSLQRQRIQPRETDDEAGDDEAGDDEGELSIGTPKTLIDFVDESNHEELLASLHSLIDSFNDSRADLDLTIGHFDESIDGIAESLRPFENPDSPRVKSTIYDQNPLPLPDLFKSMEGHAAEMATLLNSLISHYDLCVSALKHTEGGRQAARKAVLASGGELLKSGSAPGALEESLYGAKRAEPISDEERAEMVRVLEGDAMEVDDVVHELKERGVEMESLYGQLSTRSSTARSGTRSLWNAVGLLYQIKDSLPLLLDAATQFRESWLTIQTDIHAKTKELVGLRTFYEQFLTAYKKLLREVDRRKAVQTQMKKVADKARRDLDKLYRADQEARAEFVDDVGGFLPGDLWPDLADQGTRWEVKMVPPYETIPGIERSHEAESDQD